MGVGVVVGMGWRAGANYLQVVHNTCNTFLALSEVIKVGVNRLALGEVPNIRVGPVLSLTALAMLLTFLSPGLPPGRRGLGGGGCVGG